MERTDRVDELLAEGLTYADRAKEAWVHLSRDRDWTQRADATDIGALAQSFRNCAQQLGTSLGLLLHPVEQEVSERRERRGKRKERATTPDAAEALAALQGPVFEEPEENGDVPSLLAEPRELDSTDEDEKLSLEDPLAGIPMTNYAMDYSAEEMEEGADPEGLPGGTSESGDMAEMKKCNCKKSRCLKLYCECFSSGVFCEGACMCRDCLNVVQFTSLVTETRQHILDRSPNAFAPKVSSDGGHKKGCHCKKSRCLKKYCECYQANVPCTDSCKCENCRNQGPGAPRDDSPQESFFEKGAPPLTGLQICIPGRQGKGAEGRVSTPHSRLSQTAARCAPFAKVCHPGQDSLLGRRHFSRQAAGPAYSWPHPQALLNSMAAGRPSLSALVPGRHYLAGPAPAVVPLVMTQHQSQEHQEQSGLPTGADALPVSLNVQHWLGPTDENVPPPPQQQDQQAGGAGSIEVPEHQLDGTAGLQAPLQAPAFAAASTVSHDTGKPGKAQTLVLDTRGGWAKLRPSSGNTAASHGYPHRPSPPPLSYSEPPPSTTTAATAADTADDAISPPPPNLGGRARQLTSAAIEEGYGAVQAKHEARPQKVAKSGAQRPSIVSWGTAPAAPEEARDLRWAAVRKRQVLDRRGHSTISEPLEPVMQVDAAAEDAAAQNAPEALQFAADSMSDIQQQQPLVQQRATCASAVLPSRSAEVLGEAQNNGPRISGQQRLLLAKGLPPLVIHNQDEGHGKKAGKENHAMPRVVHWPKPLAPVPCTELSEAH